MEENSFNQDFLLVKKLQEIEIERNLINASSGNNNQYDTIFDND